MPGRDHRPELYLLLATIVLGSLTAFLLMGRPMTMFQKAKPGLELRVADQGGRIRVDWNTNNPLVQSAQGATLEVEDGGSFNRYPVEPNILKSGGLDYVRRSEDVLLTLTLYHDGRPGVQTSVRRIAPFSAPVVATTPPPITVQRGGNRSRRR